MIGCLPCVRYKASGQGSSSKLTSFPTYKGLVPLQSARSVCIRVLKPGSASQSPLCAVPIPARAPLLNQQLISWNYPSSPFLPSNSPPQTLKRGFRPSRLDTTSCCYSSLPSTRFREHWSLCICPTHCSDQIRSLSTLACVQI